MPVRVETTAEEPSGRDQTSNTNIVPSKETTLNAPPREQAKENVTEVSKALVLVENAINRACKMRVLEASEEEHLAGHVESLSPSSGQANATSSKALELFQRS
ncbi:hypothetical protein QJS10_CPB20g00856 [Acorus calamus]|uniref:Uncharacterized protein n=1 Tax=Acorus calamus TaxID=4465 RepID=A0AAV9CDM9_ACOCL|nr:hypothetical protein QJS10_CPB20g00856 [Acorus calamus]